MADNNDEYKKNIAYTGGYSLLVATITGPGLVTIPTTFQQAGWVLPTIMFVITSSLTGLGSLFLVDAMTKFPGNSKFEKNIELATLVNQFYGHNWHMFTQVLIYGAMQSTNIASIIISIQTFDNFLLQWAGATCGFGITPINTWYCVKTVSSTASPFGSNYMFMTTGYLVMLVIVVPLTLMKLTDNILIQFVSMSATCIIAFEWIVVFLTHGLKSSLMPAFGDNFSSVVGTVMFNYAFITAVPSWINAKHPSIDIKRSIWRSIFTATLLYMSVGIFGGLAFPIHPSSNVISTISNSEYNTTVMQLANVMFPGMCLITSIPVFIIIVRLNLVQARVCGKGMATFLSGVLPFLVCIPFQTGSAINNFMNWSSLIFNSLANFLCPFIIYMYVERRNIRLHEDDREDIDLLEYDVAMTTITQGTTPKPMETETYKIGASRMNASKSRSMGIDPNKNFMELAIQISRDQAYGKGQLGSRTGSQFLGSRTASQMMASGAISTGISASQTIVTQRDSPKQSLVPMIALNDNVQEFTSNMDVSITVPSIDPFSPELTEDDGIINTGPGITVNVPDMSDSAEKGILRSSSVNSSPVRRNSAEQQRPTDNTALNNVLMGKLGKGEAEKIIDEDEKFDPLPPWMTKLGWKPLYVATVCFIITTILVLIALGLNIYEAAYPRPPPPASYYSEN